jgi:hypothetical protein
VHACCILLQHPSNTYLPFYQLQQLDLWNVLSKHLLAEDFLLDPNVHALLSFLTHQGCSHSSHSKLLLQQDLHQVTALGTLEKLNQ